MLGHTFSNCQHANFDPGVSRAAMDERGGQTIHSHLPPEMSCAWLGSKVASSDGPIRSGLCQTPCVVSEWICPP